MVRQYGVCRIPKLLSDNAIAGLNEHFDAFFDARYTNIQIVHQDEIYRLANLDTTPGLLADFPWLDRIFFSPFCRAVANGYFRGPVELNFQFYVTENYGTDARLYQDMFQIHFDAYSTLKFMVYLWDTDIDCGPFEVVPGSHRENIGRRLDQIMAGKSYEDLVSDLPYRDIQTLPVAGPAGTMIVFDTDISHRAGFCTAGRKRRLIRAHTDSMPTRLLRQKKMAATDIGRDVLERHLR